MSLKNRVGEFLQRAIDYEEGASRATDVEMHNVLRELGEQYRRLAAETADDPYRTRETGESRRNKIITRLRAAI